jgi:tRNA (cmo5U34)-methyltransferase
MTEFNKSQWAKPEFTQGYRDSADVYIVERKRMLGILKSFYEHFSSSNPNSNILDLGCGDGVVIYELLKINNSIEATLIDGSEDMLNKAKDRLKDFGNLHFIQASFQNILNRDTTLQNYDLIVSSLAIHHLTLEEKTAFFRTIYSHLNAGGYFLNIDVVLAPSDALENWYLLLWEKWIDERKAILGIEGSQYDDIIKRYKDNTDNKPDTLASQLRALQTIGFEDVDCFYKYGIFTMYGGKK